MRLCMWLRLRGALASLLGFWCRLGLGGSARSDRSIDRRHTGKYAGRRRPERGACAERGLVAASPNAPRIAPSPSYTRRSREKSIYTDMGASITRQHGGAKRAQVERAGREGELTGGVMRLFMCIKNQPRTSVLETEKGT